MDSNLFFESFKKLEKYCALENYMGWDPYDGLNSKIFQALPVIRDWDVARLVWIQLFKRNPMNLRRLLQVPKEFNAKGIGLLLTGYCNIYKFQQLTGTHLIGNNDEILDKVHYLANLLISLKSEGYSGACWGYNFNWQARRLFLFPKKTPTVVATTFCASALMEAYEITQEEKYLKISLSSADFVLKDLKRTSKTTGFLFSYSPIEGNNTVYNASLLGTKLLIRCYQYNRDETYFSAARNSAAACVEAQNKDGSWFYGEMAIQNWIDSFHTGYNIEALRVYESISGDISFSSAIDRGIDFYIKNFFLKDGTPKYYHNKTYPIDIHCPAQLFVTLHSTDRYEQHNELADKVMDWAIQKMQDKKGYFYYQIRKGFSSRISYMRWSNAFMFYAMSYYLINTHE